MKFGGVASSGKVPVFIYIFFLVHMLAFGGSGFFMAYSEPDPPVDFLFMHGGFAIFIYLIFYLVIFGLDEVKWIFINAFLGLFGIIVEIDWILSLYDRKLSDFPVYVHIIPFLYYILYTFLIRRALIDFTGSWNNAQRKKRVEIGYIVVSIIIYLGFYFA